MLGPNLASGDAWRLVPCSPQRLLPVADQRSGRRQTLSPAKPAPRNGLSLPHSGCSFTEPPLRVRRSWPASSAPRRTGLEPVRSPAPLPVIRFPDLREAQRLQPVARTICPAPPTALRALLPLGTFDPSGSPLDPIHRSGNLPPRDTRSPFTPRLRKLCDHRRRINVPGSLRPAGLAVPRTSWNHLYLARKPARSQIENMRWIGFFRRKSGMCFQ
jgi:hypothetical protein